MCRPLSGISLRSQALRNKSSSLAVARPCLRFARHRRHTLLSRARRPHRRDADPCTAAARAAEVVSALEERRFTPASSQVTRLQTDSALVEDTRLALQELRVNYEAMRDLYLDPAGPKAKIGVSVHDPQWLNLFKARVVNLRANHLRLVKTLAGRLKSTLRRRSWQFSSRVQLPGRRKRCSRKSSLRPSSSSSQHPRVTVHPTEAPARRRSSLRAEQPRRTPASQDDPNRPITDVSSALKNRSFESPRRLEGWKLVGTGTKPAVTVDNKVAHEGERASAHHGERADAVSRRAGDHP